MVASKQYKPYDLTGKSVLLLGATSLMADVSLEAKKLGLKTWAVDYHEDSPAKQVSDHHALISTTDVGAVCAFIKDQKIDGIITGFMDSMLPFYCEICDRSGLPCYISDKALAVTTDKKRFKSLCQQFDVPVVGEHPADSLQEALNISDRYYPVIMKPADNSGARGVSICRDKNDFIRAYEAAAKFSKSNSVVVEPYLHVPEATAFYIFINGEVIFADIATRHVKSVREGFIRLPVAYTMPSKFKMNFLAHAHPQLCALFRSLEMENGMAFVQMLIPEEGPPLIYEMGYRLTGSLEYHLFERVLGFNTLHMMLNFAVNGTMHPAEQPIEVPSEAVAYSGNLTVLARPGKIGEITDEITLRNIEEVVHVHYRYKRGDTIPETAWGTLGQVVLRIMFVAESEIRLKAAMESVQRLLYIRSSGSEDLLLSSLDWGI